MVGQGDPELSRLLDDAVARLQEGDHAAAAPLYRAFLERDPARAGCWHDLGIATKHLRLWDECRSVNRRALDLEPADEGAAWNLGIAATALSDWATARDAWRAAGLDVPGGDGPVDMELGSVPIRVATESHPEVVWCRRLDPARAIILSVPTAACGRRYRDLVLHDGSSNGERLLGGRPVPVFDELEVLAPSGFSTYEASVEVERPDDVAALESLVESAGGMSEDWTASVRNLCRACSEGNPDTGAHAHPFDERWKASRTIGLAVEQDEVALRTLLARWLAGPDRSFLRRLTRPCRRTLLSLRCVTAGAPRA
jgi:hypothetical protein